MNKVLFYIYFALSFLFVVKTFAAGATAKEICENNEMIWDEQSTECIPVDEGMRRAEGTQATTEVKENPGINTSDTNAQGSALRALEYNQETADTGKVNSLENCQSSFESAENSCDPGKNSGMSSVIDMLDMISKQLGSATSASIELACSKLGTISQTASVAMTGYKINCTNSILSCENACDAEKNETNYTELIRLKKKCTAMNSKVQDAGFSINSLMATNLNSKKCEELAMNDPDYWCKKDPSSIMCTAGKPVDCTNATVAKTNAVCICRVNPRDAVCGTLTAGQINGTISSPNLNGGGTDSGALGKSADGSLSLENASGGYNPFADGTVSPGGAGGEQGALKGGAGAGMGSGGSNGMGGKNSYSQNQKSGESGINTKVIGGYGYGGGNAGSSVSGGGRSTSENGSSGNYAGGPGVQQKVDLRQFLPGGQLDPQRNIAGIAGPDGITGPNSDIWQKVQTRYGSIMRSLRP